ncbi:PREDICTED: F-box/kelch-repeat protein At2g24250-like [Camelina sativa]|uniref:F-box/kelch-repeat protein At2g24250-like n=1 Tax=Camelina sativa TaxID=90675 RepID=A0ABM0TUD8_CAMSA|nr:PREDICTED: F-box/kelch-repeat protein At2g24250-like [Camelina sativa]
MATSSIMPDWSQLPEELLHLISTHLEDYCFDLVHARSVCTSWRSTFPFPSSLLRPRYSLPHFPLESKDLCTLEKVPLFLFRVRTPPAAELPYECFLGAIGRDASDDHMKLRPPSLQCSVKVKILGYDPTLMMMNMLDCQIIPLGHQYRMIGREHNRSAFLPLDKEGGGGEFVVVSSFLYDFMVLTSVEMRWKQLENIPNGRCTNIVTFRNKFYASFTTSKVVAIDPYSLEVTILFSSPENFSYLVQSGNEELFLVEVIFPFHIEIKFRVSRLDEEAGKWVEVTDLGGRVLFICRHLGNFCCFAKKLPHGLSGNSILFSHGPRYVNLIYKYGVHTGNSEDDLNCWRPSGEKDVMIVDNFSGWKL